MVRFQPTPEQRTIANAFSRNAQLLGRHTTLQRLYEAAGERFEEPRIGQLVTHVAAKQSEFGRGVVDAFRSGRFSVATALVRPVLEMTAWLAWPFSTPNDAEQRRRLIRLLLQGYRDARNRGAELPPDAEKLLAETTGSAARRPVAFQQMLKDLDEIERNTEGGKEYWVSHADHFVWASQHVHPSFYGPLVRIGSMEPNELVGVNAVVYGHQYLAISAATCAIAAELQDLKRRVEERYAAVAEIQQAELERLTER
ncbi:MAG: hypothetical protein IRZ21_03150 [Thermoleophilaceae bacterium]|nr:hypothetical protein [Thermoleophilaceae bacterium]